MSLNDEINRLKNAKEGIRNALEDKGVSVPQEEKIDAYAGYIKSMETGSLSVIAYGTCSSGASSSEKIVTLDSSFPKWQLEKGSIISVKFTATNTASNATLNVNGSGAIPIWYNNAVYTSNSNIAGYAKRYTTFMYDGEYWVWLSHSVDNNTTYTNVSLGQGFGVCDTEASTVAKTATITSYALTVGGIVAIRFNNDVPANSTLNIYYSATASRGAKPIIHKGTNIESGVIKAGDVATFMYVTSVVSTGQYILLSIDRSGSEGLFEIPISLQSYTTMQLSDEELKYINDNIETVKKGAYIVIAVFGSLSMNAIVVAVDTLQKNVLYATIGAVIYRIDLSTGRIYNSEIPFVEDDNRGKIPISRGSNWDYIDPIELVDIDTSKFLTTDTYQTITASKYFKGSSITYTSSAEGSITVGDGTDKRTATSYATIGNDGFGVYYGRTSSPYITTYSSGNISSVDKDGKITRNLKLPSGEGTLVTEEKAVTTDTTQEISGRKKFTYNDSGYPTGWVSSYVDGKGLTVEWRGQGQNLGAYYQASGIYFGTADNPTYNYLYFPDDSGVIATQEWAKDNLVTTDTEQTISAKKIFEKDGYKATIAPNIIRVSYHDSEAFFEAGGTLGVIDNNTDDATVLTFGAITYRKNDNDYDFEFPQQGGTFATREWAKNNLVTLDGRQEITETKVFTRNGSLDERTDISFNGVGSYEQYEEGGYRSSGYESGRIHYEDMEASGDTLFTDIYPDRIKIYGDYDDKQAELLYPYEKGTLATREWVQKNAGGGNASIPILDLRGK